MYCYLASRHGPFSVHGHVCVGESLFSPFRDSSPDYDPPLVQHDGCASYPIPFDYDILAILQDAQKSSTTVDHFISDHMQSLQNTQDARSVQDAEIASLPDLPPRRSTSWSPPPPGAIMEGSPLFLPSDNLEVTRPAVSSLLPLSSPFSPSSSHLSLLLQIPLDKFLQIICNELGHRDLIKMVLFFIRSEQ
jgi:hypothetical protein